MGNILTMDDLLLLLLLVSLIYVMLFFAVAKIKIYLIGKNTEIKMYKVNALLYFVFNYNLLILLCLLNLLHPDSILPEFLQV